MSAFCLFADFEVLLRRRKKTQHYHLWVGSGQAIDSMIQDRINRVTERLSALFCVKTHALVSFLVPGYVGSSESVWN